MTPYQALYGFNPVVIPGPCCDQGRIMSSVTAELVTRLENNEVIVLIRSGVRCNSKKVSGCSLSLNHIAEFLWPNE